MSPPENTSEPAPPTRSELEARKAAARQDYLAAAQLLHLGLVDCQGPKPIFAVGSLVNLDGGTLYEVRDRELANGLWFYSLKKGEVEKAGLFLEERLSAPRKPTLRQLKAEDRLAAYGVVDCEACGAEMTVGNMYGMGQCESCGFHRNPTREDFQATVEEHLRRVPRAIFGLSGPEPHLGIHFGSRAKRIHYEIDRRLRTSPHGDALDTAVTDGLFPFAASEVPFLLQSGFKPSDSWVAQRWYGVDIAQDETHFTLTPLQREFLERTKGGGRVFVTRPRSSGWPETFRMAEEMFRAARERAQPWWDDALAAENGMGC